MKHSPQSCCLRKRVTNSVRKVNVNGGAIALGHPYGASGAMLVTRLFYQAQRESMKYGIATLGIGGGIGIALLFEKVED